MATYQIPSGSPQSQFPVWPPPSGGYPNVTWEGRPQLVGTPGRTFPAGSYIDGNGVFITLSASTIVQTMDLSLNNKIGP